MTHVVTTDRFERDAKALKKKFASMTGQLRQLIESLENQPAQGVHIGLDCYKIRLAIVSKGRGKSGGARVITCYKMIDEEVYLLTIYDKSEKADLATGELKEILKAEGLYPA